MRLFIALLGLSLALQTSTVLAAEPALGSATEQTDRLPPGRVEVYLEDLHCKTCAKRVSRKLYAEKGVAKVATSLKKDLVSITLTKNSEVEPVKLWQAILSAGHTPTTIHFADQSIDAEEMASLLEAEPTDSNS